MKSKKTLCIGIMFILSIVFVGFFKIDTNAADTITDITLGNNYSSSISETNIERNYRFTLNNSGRCTFNVASTDFSRIRLTLYDKNQMEIWTSGYGYASHVYTLDLINDTYTLKISKEYETGSYNLVTTYTNAYETYTEDNGTLNSANTIVCGNTYKGQIAYNREGDCYRFTLNDSGKCTFNVVSTDFSRVRLTLYDKNQIEIWTSGYGYTSSPYTLDLTKDTYILKVSKEYETGAYTIITTAPSVTYNINYILNGGINNSDNKSTYQNTSETLVLKNPKRKGYLFAGWYKDATFIEKITQIDEGTSGNLTFYAKWTKIQVSKAKTPSLSNMKKKKLIVTYKATNNVKGYQIQIAKNKKFTKGVKSKVTTSRQCVFSKLEKKTKYYVRVRAYTLDSTGAKVYGYWSNIKSKTIKK